MYCTCTVSGYPRMTCVLMNFLCFEKTGWNLFYKDYKTEKRELFYRHCFFVNKYPTTVVKYFLFLKNPDSQSTIVWKYKRFYYITFLFVFLRLAVKVPQANISPLAGKSFEKCLRLAIPTLICSSQTLKIHNLRLCHPIGRKEMQTICVFKKSCIWKVSFKKSR